MKYAKTALLVSAALAALQMAPVAAQTDQQAVRIAIRINDKFGNEPVRQGDSGQVDYTIMVNNYPTSSRSVSFGSCHPEILTIDIAGKWEALEPGETEVGASYSPSGTDTDLNIDPSASIVNSPLVLKITVDNGRDDVYRLYNPNSGEHFYTVHQDERDSLVTRGWKYEGIAWQMPKESKYPIYRVYNPNAGDHHYTASKEEVNFLVEKGWRDEGISFYDTAYADTHVYRLYNPNAKAGAHHFTMDQDEANHLTRIGWNAEDNDWMPFSK